MHAQRSTTPAHWRNRSACCRAARPQRTQAKGSSPAGATWAAVRAAALPNEGAGGGAAAAATGALSRSHTATQAQQPLAAASCMSGGLPISSYTASEALAAVSNKTFGCTMCGKCCTLDADAEVRASAAAAGRGAGHCGTVRQGHRPRNARAVAPQQRPLGAATALTCPAVRNPRCVQRRCGQMMQRWPPWPPTSG
jgi:hypothetical protein